MAMNKATKVISAGGSGASANFDVGAADTVTAVQINGTSGAAAGSVLVQRSLMDSSLTQVWVTMATVTLAGAVGQIVDLVDMPASAIRIDTTSVSGGAVDVYATIAKEN